jgi:hypothetical protein
MQRVNAAMRERDLTAMRTLLSEAEVTDVAFEARSIGEKLVWAIREIARLDEVIAELERDLATLRNSDSHGLWHRQESGEQVIERLTADLKRDLASAQSQLAALVSTYRGLVEARSKPR